MKRRFQFSGILVQIWIAVFSLVGQVAYSQDEVAQAQVQNEEFTLELPKAGLRHNMADTILPTISNSGLGLVNYEMISVNDIEKEERNMTLIRFEGYTETELKILREQQQEMDEHYHIELQQQIRKDKMDLQLGEIIKDFYVQPPF
jgi:uncharacterized membrane protein YfbV (UPF0208 family)